MVDIIQITSRSSLVRSVAEESYRALRMRQLPPDIADLVVEFGREGTTADTCRVSLRNS